MKKQIIINAGFFGLFMLFTFLKTGLATGPVNNKDKGDKPVVAFLMDALYTDRWYKDKDFFKKFAKEEGVEVIVKIANSQPATQKQQAREVIEAGADVLVVVPADAQKAGDIVDIAHEAGVKVIAYDRLIKHKDLDYFISFDSKKVGKIQASHALEKAPTGKYALVNGPKRDFNSLLYKRGAMKILKPREESGDIEIVYNKHQGEWAEMEAYMTISQMILPQHPDIDAIIAANDMFAIGANMALTEDKLSGKVVLTGMDATKEGVQMLIDGTLDITIYKPIKKLASKAAKVASQMAKGKQMEAPERLKINSTEYNCWLLDVVKVTRDNIRETVIKDGHIKKSALTFD